MSKPISRSTRWLMKGDVDKPVYFITKVNKLEKLKKENPNLKKIYERNGYVFLIREDPFPPRKDNNVPGNP